MSDRTSPKVETANLFILLSEFVPHLAGGVLDGVFVEDGGNAGVRQALLDDALELVALVRLEHDAAAAQARCHTRHEPLRQIERVCDSDHRQPRPGPRRPLTQVVEHLRALHSISAQSTTRRGETYVHLDT